MHRLPNSFAIRDEAVALAAKRRAQEEREEALALAEQAEVERERWEQLVHEAQ